MKPYHEIEDYGDGKDAIKIDKYGNQTYQVQSYDQRLAKSPNNQMNNMLKKQIEMNDLNSGKFVVPNQLMFSNGFKRLAERVKLSKMERYKLLNNEYTIYDSDINEVMSTGPTKIPQNLSQLIFWGYYGPLKFYKQTDPLNKLGLRSDSPRTAKGTVTQNEAKSNIESIDVSVNSDD